MNKQEIIELYREFTNDTEELINLVEKYANKGCSSVANTADVMSVALANGVYVIFNDGSYTPFDANDTYDSDEVRHIGIVHDTHRFAVVLKSYGEHKLVDDYSKCQKDYEGYKDSSGYAMFDWDFVKNTKHLQEIGTAIPLQDGEYIPTLPMLLIMFHYKNILNEALETVGGTPLEQSYTWSSTEYSAYGAWGVHFGSGYVYGNGKYGRYVVRAVSAWD